MPRKTTKQKQQPDKEVRLTLSHDLFLQLQKIAVNRQIDLDDLLRIAVKNILLRSKLVELHTKLPFGKYEGETFENVAKADCRYARWMLTNVENLEFTPECLVLVEAMENPK